MLIKKAFSSIRNESKRMGYLKLADAIENLITNGTLKGNTRLPSTKELIDIFGVSRLTVQRSLARLNDRKLIKRTPGVGSFVSTGFSSNTVGLLSGDDPIAIPSPFYRLLLCEFYKTCNEFSVKFNNYIFMENFDIARNFINLEQDIIAGKLECLIVISSTKEMNNWLRKHCTIPYIFPAKPAYDQMAYMGVTHLCKAGYKKIKVFSIHPEGSSNIPGKQKEKNAILRAYKECGSPGELPELITCGQHEIDGYNCAKKILSSPKDRPDAFYINHDILTQGIIMAALEFRLSIPNDLGLITHRNKGVEVISPVPLDTVWVSPEEIAKNTLKFARLNSKDLKFGSNTCPYETKIEFTKGKSTKG